MPSEGVTRVEVAREDRPEPAEEVLERQIGGSDGFPMSSSWMIA